MLSFARDLFDKTFLCLVSKLKLLFKITILFFFLMKVLYTHLIITLENAISNASRVKYAVKRLIRVIESRTRMTFFKIGSTLI